MVFSCVLFYLTHTKSVNDLQTFGVWSRSWNQKVPAPECTFIKFLPSALCHISQFVGNDKVNNKKWLFCMFGWECLNSNRRAHNKGYPFQPLLSVLLLVSEIFLSFIFNHSICDSIFSNLWIIGKLESVQLVTTFIKTQNLSWYETKYLRFIKIKIPIAIISPHILMFTDVIFSLQIEQKKRIAHGSKCTDDLSPSFTPLSPKYKYWFYAVQWHVLSVEYSYYFMQISSSICISWLSQYKLKQSGK